MEDTEAICARGELELMGPYCCPICRGIGKYRCAHCIDNEVENHGGRVFIFPGECDACNDMYQHECARCLGTGRLHARGIRPFEEDCPELRDIDIEGYRLQLWETVERMGTGQQKLAYRLTSPEGFILFEAKDYGCSPMDSIDGDDTVRGLLNFLTLKTGDTDEEYFYRYTQEQLEFAEGPAEQLSIWTLDPEDDEYADPKPDLDEDGEPIFFRDWVEKDEGETVPSSEPG